MVDVSAFPGMRLALLRIGPPHFRWLARRVVIGSIAGFASRGDVAGA